jgi:tRNA-dihydrouridine synthase B
MQGTRVNFPLCLAPMVGLSHVALRLIIREYMPPGAFTLWPTEMLNSRKLPYEDFAKVPETMKGPCETELVPQILGNEAGAIAASIRKLEDWGAVAIDINMGCPVQKALRHNYGVALMGDSTYAAEVVAMATKVARVPVSVKLRAAERGTNPDFLFQFVRGLQEAGAAWVCLHPRTAEQKRRGNADWSQIRQLRDTVDIPVIGNGDIQTAEDVHQMRAQTGCELVMAGRALAARPWLMWQVGEDLGWPSPPGFGGFAPRTPEEEGTAYGRVLLRLIDLSELYFGEDLALRKVRFWIRTTCCWLFYGQNLIQISTKAKNLREMRTFVGELFSNPMPMVPRTDLRQ